MSNNDKQLKEMVERLSNSVTSQIELKHVFEKETDELIKVFAELNRR